MQHRKVADVMTREVVAVTDETPFSEIETRSDDGRPGAFPRAGRR